MDEHPIPGFASLHRDQLNARSPDVQLSALFDRHVRPEAAHVGKVEILTEELFIEDAPAQTGRSQSLPIIVPGIETRPRSERAEIRVPTWPQWECVMKMVVNCGR